MTEISSEDDFFEVVEKKEKSIYEQINTEKELATLDLLKLTRAKMEKSEKLEKIIDRASEILLSRLIVEDDQELADISNGSLTNIIKELSKVNGDLLGSILQATSKSSGAQTLTPDPVPVEKEVKQEKEISKQDFETAKKLVKFINLLGDGSAEFPEVEENDQ